MERAEGGWRHEGAEARCPARRPLRDGRWRRAEGQARRQNALLSAHQLPGAFAARAEGRDELALTDRKKDDNAHIEQKTWTHVHELLGYVCYDSPAVQAAIYALYRHELRRFQNLPLASVKLRTTEQLGARVRRRYDASRSPFGARSRLSRGCPRDRRPAPAQA